MPPKTVRVGEKLAIKGDIVGAEDVELAGRFEGTIAVQGIVVIGDRAEVNANITAATVVIEGRLRGKVIAEGRVLVMPSGALTGDVRSRSLTVSEGASLRGAVDIRPAGGRVLGSAAAGDAAVAERHGAGEGATMMGRGTQSRLEPCASIPCRAGRAALQSPPHASLTWGVPT